jgi:NAD(P)-dependent dehydrogenase (short-subunit alcohol dehydrogenase family)
VSNGLFDLSGKTALVTGGNSGIGLGFAEGLAMHGANVCIWGTNAEKNAKALERLEPFGTKVDAMICDVGDRAAVQARFAETVEKFGRVDSCFANAGIGGRGTPFLAMDLDEWQAIFRVNMEGVFHTLQCAIRHMVEQKIAGSLVVTSSGSAVFGAPRTEHYAATKAGVLAMMRGLAVEHARHGIRVNGIVPGWIDTPMTENVVNNEVYQQKVLTRIPLRRWGTGDDFRALAVYLASDASAYHTGDMITIDGGYECF